MPLKIIVVGAGIAGLCAAVSLRQAGHEVEVCLQRNFMDTMQSAKIISTSCTAITTFLPYLYSLSRVSL